MDVGPVDAELLVLCVELCLPQGAVGVLDLFEVEPFVLVDDPPVVERHGVVDARAEEHRSRGRFALTADVFPAPRLPAHHPQAVGRRRQVPDRLAVVADGQLHGHWDPPGELRRARRLLLARRLFRRSRSTSLTSPIQEASLVPALVRARAAVGRFAAHAAWGGSSAPKSTLVTSPGAALVSFAAAG